MNANELKVIHILVSSVPENMRAEITDSVTLKICEGNMDCCFRDFDRESWHEICRQNLFYGSHNKSRNNCFPVPHGLTETDNYGIHLMGKCHNRRCYMGMT